MKRAIIIVMDSVGIGEMPDSWEYGDQGSNTLGNISRELGGRLRLPNLQSLGLANIAPIPYLEPVNQPRANYGKMAEKSKGKDTTTGHWEIAGLILDQAFPTFPQGFPPEFISNLENKIGRGLLGNEVASGTEIIQRLGDEHVRTGKPIVYTSADSVFQIAAHEEVIPLEELMSICRAARAMLDGDLRVARVIARPFIGQTGNYKRTANRQDFSVEPQGETLLDKLTANGRKVMAVGKVYDIFAGKGISESISIRNNMDGVDKTINILQEKSQFDLIFTNLVDFDMIYGHRNNVSGYAQALEEFDSRLPDIIGALQEEDMLFITADHGCDPTTSSTDHSREYVPLLVYGQGLKKGVNLGIRSTFADLGATAAEYLGLEPLSNGRSFYQEIKEG
ncbi:MAG: phosphopentomutase [Peptococcaceae bacterium]|nr:phosphopentomutase [Peptococcaceae bacterium]